MFCQPFPQPASYTDGYFSSQLVGIGQKGYQQAQVSKQQTVKTNYCGRYKMFCEYISHNLRVLSCHNRPIILIQFLSLFLTYLYKSRGFDIVLSFHKSLVITDHVQPPEHSHCLYSLQNLFITIDLNLSIIYHLDFILSTEHSQTLTQSNQAEFTNFAHQLANFKGPHLQLD